MKVKILMTAILLVVTLVGGMADLGRAGTAQEIKKESKAAAQEIKEAGVETSKVFIKAGKEVKQGSKETWKEIKEGVKAAGGEFKKAYQEGKKAVKKEIAGENTKEAKASR